MTNWKFHNEQTKQTLQAIRKGEVSSKTKRDVREIKLAYSEFRRDIADNPLLSGLWILAVLIFGFIVAIAYADGGYK